MGSLGQKSPFKHAEASHLLALELKAFGLSHRACQASLHGSLV